MKDDGSISLDDNVGRFRGIDLSGANTYVIVQYTKKWTDLSEEEKKAFRDNLVLSWGSAAQTKYSSGLVQKFDKQYSSGSLGVQRSVLGG